MKKVKKSIIIFAIAILCIVIAIFLILTMPSIETHTWILSSAQQADAPHFVVAHNKDYDVSDDELSLFELSKPIELICEAKNGKLILTDKTNDKTYEGTYSVDSWGRFRAFKGKNYKVIIDGLEGTANISSNFNRTLFISIGGYYLNFEFVPY